MTQDAVGVTGPVPFQSDLFDVVSTAPVLVPDDNGYPTQGLRITFTVVGAGEQYLELPFKGLTEDSALAAINERVLLIVGILELSGPLVNVGPDGKPQPINIAPAV